VSGFRLFERARSALGGLAAAWAYQKDPCHSDYQIESRIYVGPADHREHPWKVHLSRRLRSLDCVSFQSHLLTRASGMAAVHAGDQYGSTLAGEYSIPASSLGSYCCSNQRSCFRQTTLRHFSPSSSTRTPTPGRFSKILSRCLQPSRTF
jgi:hypothetical protein